MKRTVVAALLSLVLLLTGNSMTGSNLSAQGWTGTFLVTRDEPHEQPVFHARPGSDPWE